MKNAYYSWMRTRRRAEQRCFTARLATELTSGYYVWQSGAKRQREISKVY